MRKKDKKNAKIFSRAAGGGGLAKSLRAGDPHIPPPKWPCGFGAKPPSLYLWVPYSSFFKITMCNSVVMMSYQQITQKNS